MGTVLLLLWMLTVGTFAGWAGHWALHRPWAGPLYLAHLRHHMLYPPSDFESVRYRGAGWKSTVFSLGTVVALLVLATLYAASRLGFSGAELGAAAAFAAVLGWAHNYVHDAFHVRGHWLGRFAAFRRLKALHRVHHKHVRKNLGIIWMDWDRAFGTIRDR